MQYNKAQHTMCTYVYKCYMSIYTHVTFIACAHKRQDNMNGKKEFFYVFVFWCFVM
jgi:hypothetical protein